MSLITAGSIQSHGDERKIVFAFDISEINVKSASLLGVPNRLYRASNLWLAYFSTRMLTLTTQVFGSTLRRLALKMFDSTSFSGTVTGGIQGVLALLVPLLGTKQCEKHVGSALDRGFLHSSVTPVSIFGSLGIVRAAFNILIASLNIQRYSFLGATKLSDGGFTPSGVVAPMITLDVKHPKRFLAETRLEAMLTEEHIENVEGLTVSWAEGILWWNFFLVAFTFVISSIGLVPYIRLILDLHNVSLKALFPLGFGFPILRVVGSGLCVNVAQFLIQLRVLVLLKTRLLYITINQLAKEAGIDLESEINAKLEREKSKSAWNSELASEQCIWALERFLANPNVKSSKHHRMIEEIYTSQHKRQMGSIDTGIPRWLGPLLVVGLVLGCLSTIAGYIGCFYLIQHSTSLNGPLFWLLLEALLSIIRILAWAINPSWDNSKGIVFELQLASHAPLITCNKFEDDIVHDGIAPLTCSNRFLQDVVAYTGPFPAFVVDGVSLYYILTAKGGSDSKDHQVPPPGMLYIVLFAHKDGTSRVLFKEPQRETFFIYLSSLEPVQGSTAINVRVNYSKRTDPKTHFLTSDAAFVTHLEAHYDEINLKIQKQLDNPDRKAFFGKTWAMQRLTEDDDGDKNVVADYGGPMSQHHRESGSLTAEDIAYLRHGQVARRWHSMYKQLEEWIGLFIALHTQELLQDAPADQVFENINSMEIAQKCKANEAEFLLIECQRILELFLISTGRKWDEFLKVDHAGMVATVLKGTFNYAADLKQGVDTSSKQGHTEESRKNKMMIRLTDELEDLLAREVWMRRDNIRERLTAQMNSADQRIQGGKYTDAARKAISDSWKALSADISSKAGGLDWPEPEEPESVVNSVSHSGSIVSSGITDGVSASTQEDTKALDSRSPGILEDNETLLWLGSRRDFQQSHEPEGPLASRRSKFTAQMEARYQAVVKNIKKSYHDTERDKQLMGVKQMNDRCQHRADQLFSRLEDQMAEFEDLHINEVLTADTHELVDYWSKGSLQERRRLQNRGQKYLKLSDASIAAVGGPRNMLRALKRSQDFSYIDIRDSDLLTGEELTSVVECITSVTGVSLSQDEDINEAVMANVQTAEEAHRDMCFCSNLTVTDYYRTGQPYLLFRDPGTSLCRVHFHIQAKCDHIITLRHCVTTSEGKVNIKLNGHELRGSWGQTQAVQFNFTNEDIRLPSCHLREVGQPNVLEIILDNESFGVYWLSDVFLPVRPVQVSVTSDITTA